MIAALSIFDSYFDSFLFAIMTEKKIVDDHRQKYVEITKDCLWNELQNYCLESTEKKISLSAD